jgi:hypothetical protein
LGRLVRRFLLRVRSLFFLRLLPPTAAAPSTGSGASCGLHSHAASRNLAELRLADSRGRLFLT